DARGVPYRQSYLEARLGGEQPPQGNIFADLLQQNLLPAPYWMLRLSAIADVGGYDEGLFYEDLDMWLRLSSRYRFIYSPGQAVRIRMHSESLSSRPQNWSPMCRSSTSVLAKWLKVGLDDVARERLLDALFWNAALQLRHNDPAGARITFDHVIRNDRRLMRLLLAHAGRLP